MVLSLDILFISGPGEYAPAFSSWCKLVSSKDDRLEEAEDQWRANTFTLRRASLSVFFRVTWRKGRLSRCYVISSLGARSAVTLLKRSWKPLGNLNPLTARI